VPSTGSARVKNFFKTHPLYNLLRSFFKKRVYVLTDLYILFMYLFMYCASLWAPIKQLAFTTTVSYKLRSAADALSWYNITFTPKNRMRRKIKQYKSKDKNDMQSKNIMNVKT